MFYSIVGHSYHIPAVIIGCSADGTMGRDCGARDTRCLVLAGHIRLFAVAFDQITAGWVGLAFGKPH